MEINTKTAVILVLGAILIFALFQMGGTKADDQGTGAAIRSQDYGGNPAYSQAPKVRTVNNIPSAVGGC